MASQAYKHPVLHLFTSPLVSFSRFFFPFPFFLFLLDRLDLLSRQRIYYFPDPAHSSIIIVIIIVLSSLQRSIDRSLYTSTTSTTSTNLPPTWEKIDLQTSLSAFPSSALFFILSFPPHSPPPPPHHAARGTTIRTSLITTSLLL